MDAKTRRALRKRDKKLARQKAIKIQKAAELQEKQKRMSSTEDLMRGFGADVIALMTHGQELKMLTRERLKFIRAQRDAAPGVTAGLKTDGFEQVESQLPEFEESIKALAKIKGKLDDLTSNEDRMFFVAENMDALTNAQLVFDKLRVTFEAAENDFRKAMHNLRNPMGQAAPMDTPTAPETPAEETVTEGVAEEHQDVEIDVPQDQAEQILEQDVIVPGSEETAVVSPAEHLPDDSSSEAPNEPEQSPEMPKESAQEIESPASPSDGPKMAPIG